MLIACKAQSPGLGRTTKKVLPRYDSISKRCEVVLNHTAKFSSPTKLRTSVYGVESVARNTRNSPAKERQRAERTQLTRLLKESPGKRDARNFLKHFDSPRAKPKKPASTPTVDKVKEEVVDKAHHNEWRLKQTGLNLGNLYEPTRIIQDAVFTREELPEEKYEDKDAEPLHLALVKLRQPQALDDKTLDSIALTLSQMAMLGLNIAVVVDCDEDATSNPLFPSSAREQIVREQVTRVVAALEEHNESGAFGVDQALRYSNVDTEIPSTVRVRGGVEVGDSHLLYPPMEDGIIPVIPPFAYTSALKKVRVQADDVVLALTREFAGLTNQKILVDERHQLHDTLYENIKVSPGQPVLDRLIIIDPLGGIPADHRADGAHVFINLEAEYQDIRTDLQRASLVEQTETHSSKLSPFGSSNPFSRFVESEIVPLPGMDKEQIPKGSTPNRHTKNLDMVQRALKLLPPSSSALIITPAEAAISSQATTSSPDVRNRPLKNPLIHNLLTDRPMTSSSLPTSPAKGPLMFTQPNPPTFLKKGIPVTMIPDPRPTAGWVPPSPTNRSIELENDPRIDFPKLVNLIEDSFRRKLDAKHYLDRIRGRVAGVIIAGDYEGGAICTWETPSSLLASPNNLPPDSPLWIPYLDKFAVLTSSQGSGGVADIVWYALTRSCFPQGVLWRSRRTNPVNKWYAERSVGMWNIEGEQWSMFWTTEGVVEEWAKTRNSVEKVKGNNIEMTRWDAYLDVCGGVVPSWADGKKPD